MIGEHHAHHPFNSHVGLLRPRNLGTNARRPGQEPQPVGSDGTHARGNGGHEHRARRHSRDCLGLAVAPDFPSSADAPAQGSTRRYGTTPLPVNRGDVRHPRQPFRRHHRVRSTRRTSTLDSAERTRPWRQRSPLRSSPIQSSWRFGGCLRAASPDTVVRRLTLLRSFLRRGPWVR